MMNKCSLFISLERMNKLKRQKVGSPVSSGFGECVGQ